jgi:hypothetical protein
MVGGTRGELNRSFHHATTLKVGAQAAEAGCQATLSD